MTSDATHGFSTLLDQQRPLTILSHFLQKGHVPHALLFTGIAGVGRRRAARTFAMALNCRHRLAFSADAPAVWPEPCGRCKSCRKIAGRSHPDVLWTEPAGAYIRIGQVRELCDVLLMKPYEAKTRIAVIAEAQRMNLEAANGLLKMLEEPPRGTVLILIAPQTADLLPTIVSRCQHLRFHPIRPDRLAAWLTAENGIAAERAVALASMAGGSPAKAMEMNNEDWIRRRNWLIHEINSLDRRSVAGVLAFAEKLTEGKDMLDDSLEIIKLWLRDVAVAKFDEQKIVNKDLTPTCQYASHNTNVERLTRQIGAVQAAQKKIRSNANPRLTMDAMCLQLAADGK